MAVITRTKLFLVSPKTWEHRVQLKALGGRWDAEQGSWAFQSESSFDKALALIEGLEESSAKLEKAQKMTEMQKWDAIVDVRLNGQSFKLDMPAREKSATGFVYFIHGDRAVIQAWGRGVHSSARFEKSELTTVEAARSHYSVQLANKKASKIVCLNPYV
jgi:hypothetical protein